MFTNNLILNDRVLDTVSGKQGKVKKTPRSPSQRRTSIVFDGQQTPRYLDVMQLRLLIGGQPERVAPVEGEPPPLREPKNVVRQPCDNCSPEFDCYRSKMACCRKVPLKPVDVPTSALETLKAERTRNTLALAEHEKQFRALKSANEKLDRAIAVFSESE